VKADREKYEKGAKEMRKKYTIIGMDGRDDLLMNLLAIADQLMGFEKNTVCRGSPSGISCPLSTK
jgi:hypothetical protein